jgi:hypothetical protein
MNNSSIKILSRHSKISEAVKAAKIDLSYNEELALSDLARHDKDKAFVASFVVERHGKVEVMFAYQCDILLLNTYSPFHGCLDDSPFYFVVDKGDCFEQNPVSMPKSIRKSIASLQKGMSASIYVSSKF